MPPEIDEAPAEQDQPTTPEAPETDQPTSEEESFTDAFKPADLPEEVRPVYEEAYKRLQSDYTKKTQEYAQERQEAQELRQFVEAMQDPAQRDAILEREFGYQFEDEEPEEFLDPNEELQARVEQLEGNLTQQQEAQMAAQQEAEVTEQMAEQIEGLEKAKGDDFEYSPKELAFLTSYAHNNPMPNGAPDLKGADDALNEILDQRKEAWIASKKSPRRISQGSAAQKAFDPTSKEERYKFYDEVAQEAEA